MFLVLLFLLEIMMGIIGCIMKIDNERYEFKRPVRLNKRQPKALRQLNEGVDKKKEMTARFMSIHEQRAAERMTAEQVQRNIRNMFASLEAQRGV